MTEVNLSEARALKDHYDNNIEELRGNLQSTGADVDGSRTIGTYVGASGGVLGIVGGETQLAYAYDQETGESYVFSYNGATFGVGSPLPGTAQFGGFTFTGAPTGISGFSGGFQGASGVSSGVSINEYGEILAQYGVEIDLSVEFTFGYATQLLPLTPEMLANQHLLSQILDGLTNPNNYLDHLTLTHCFKSDTSIQMWPLDPSIQPLDDGSYDEEFVLSKVWEKPICEIEVGDIVVAYDRQGQLAPKPVIRTMTNSATHLLDFWNTGVTPGHAYYCADGKFNGQHVPLMDILRTDGAIMRADGTKIRAATNCKVGSMGDMMIHASATVQKSDGTWTESKSGVVRFGTRIILPDGKHKSFMEMAASEGWKVSDDGYMVGMIKGEDGELLEQKFHFPYAHGEELPKPEDYILTRSDLSLEAIYAAGEWEQIGTQMPAPARMVGLNTNHTSAMLQPSRPEPNIPPAFAEHPDVPNVKRRKALT